MEPLLTFLAGGVVGFVLEKVLDGVWSRAVREARRRRVRARARRHVHASDLRIHTVASGIPWFRAEAPVRFRDSGKEFYLAFPSALADGLGTRQDEFRLVDSLPPALPLPFDLSEPSQREALERARREVAEDFLERRAGCYFNNPKYGVIRADGFSRSLDENEDPILDVLLYRTDYFTHHVVHRAAARLGLGDRLITNAVLDRELPLLRTALGLSIVVVLPSTNQLLMTLRSKNAAYSDGRRWIYVGATEAITLTDYDPQTKAVNIWQTVRRALEEELGLTESMVDMKSVRVLDMFFDEPFLQDGIVVEVSLSEDVTLDRIRSLRAKDGMLEVDELFTIGADESSVRRFVREHRADLRDRTVYALRAFTARRGI